jgi:1,2-diacylglycerol 3-alpha-glucosyltransferase
MRILFGTDTYYPNVNGASYFAQRLAAGLRNIGDDVYVICPSQSTRSGIRKQDGVVIHEVASLTVPLYRALRFSPLPFVYNFILGAVHQIKPDLIHIQDHFFIGRALTRISRDLNIPIIGTNHLVNDWIWHDLTSVYNRLPNITTPSSVGAELLKRRGIRRAVAVVSCGVDLSRFNPSRRDSVIRSKYKIQAIPTYMYVGRLDKEKHIDDLIKALPIVLEEIDAQFVIVGSGKLRAQLVELAKREHVLTNVVFTGFIPDDDLPNAYAACDVFCIAGTAELQSIVTLEAMATRKPIIAARAMALPALVREGVNGYTFQPGDINTLARRLIELLSDQTKREAMGQRSLDMSEHHRIETTLDIYRNLYKAAIGHRVSVRTSLNHPPASIAVSLDSCATAPNALRNASNIGPIRTHTDTATI